ncbi:hypothetical protein [Mesorhizobium sp. M00.F.Ca.ET.216.01.1.1]|uniref:hypothetical protein n=1 Tax=Mesorhizobium sp. M00.F.Ca.ET.216.01.1.1 TaxID=2500528 RepID=UPI000FDB2684|nr:hypothetical protein [Mesorhizobium sp. M00.F.Ca.ET.216.01.1.1]TGQ31443.1 hypothetical protein EN859_029860 [Mesorhizobium sp. M00.F.Ca.ET.216.01.1.1]TJW05327.1 MAG: hypothetical protein E5W82_29805 [Mesorhizobium sp.]TJW41767.1 MAG: hypothetical protein E5W83_24610 [Mesorhizobium sp.]
MLAGIDLRQSGNAKLGYTEPMKIALAQLRLLLAVILLIAGGAVAGFAGQASAMGTSVDVATLSTSASHEMMGHVASTDQDNHRAPCNGCLDCAHSTGSGCCAAGISASECGILRPAPDAAHFMAGRAFPATGIDPEALLQPPRIFA